MLLCFIADKKVKPLILYYTEEVNKYSFLLIFSKQKLCKLIWIRYEREKIGISFWVSL